MVALVPALVAVVSLYGIVTGPAEVERQLRTLTDSMPRDVATLLRNLLRTTSTKSSGGLGVGFAIGLAGAIWSASSGMRALINGLNIAYDEEERRRFVALRGRALTLTLGSLMFTLALLVALLAAPSALGDGAAGTVIAIGRWPVIVGAIVVALAVIYRYGPDRDEPRWNWVSWGAGVATMLWIVGSVLFSVYAAHLGRFDKPTALSAGRGPVALALPQRLRRAGGRGTKRGDGTPDGS
jgi:membrane protein